MALPWSFLQNLKKLCELMAQSLASTSRDPAPQQTMHGAGILPGQTVAEPLGKYSKMHGSRVLLKTMDNITKSTDILALRNSRSDIARFSSVGPWSPLAWLILKV